MTKIVSTGFGEVWSRLWHWSVVMFCR